MSSHAATIPYLRAMLEADERHSFLAALDALLAENQRLREALERIVPLPTRSESIVAAPQIAREALAGDTE